MPQTNAPAVSLERVTVAFGAGATRYVAVEAADLSVTPGEFVAIVGPTGCGKSTLLNIVAGLLKPAAGRARVQGADVAGVMAPCGYLFQQDALMPWKTARDNVGFALLPSGLTRAARRARAEELLAEVGLAPEAAELYPRQLSGGMRQRVALARALAVGPDLLLCDEPFSALDRAARNALCQLLRDIQAREGLTTLFVTHDAEEAQALADVVAVMTPGRIETVGPPETVLPATPAG